MWFWILIGIVLIVLASVLRGYTAYKTGNGQARGTLADISCQSFRAKELTREIHKKRDSFRGLPVVETAITKIFDGFDAVHLPAKIKLTVEGVFIIAFDPKLGKYNPAWEQRLTAEDLPAFDYLNGCAFFLLIQEKYPGLYNFPNTKVDNVDYGVVEEIRLELKSAGEVATW